MANTDRKPNGYWNYEHCYAAAKECKTKYEFQKKYKRAWNVARENGWLKDYTWFIEVRKPKGYYTYEKCFELAGECRTIKEFNEKYTRAYQVSIKNKWIENFTWFERKSKPYGFWKNYDNCFSAARECKSRAEMCEKYNQAYIRALEYGWIDDYTWFETQANYMTDSVDNVYVYLWEKEKIAYVGRTVDPKGRDKEHRGIYLHCGKEDAMFKYCKKHNLEIPEMTMLVENITLQEGLDLEDKFKKHYKELGYTLINKAPTGVGSGSTGGIGRDKYTKKHCEAVAKQCKTNNEFYKEHNGEWQKAYKKGWLKDYIWFEEIKKPNGFWKDRDNCFSAAKECKTSREFRKRFTNAYAYSRKMGWHLDYTWFEDVRVVKGTW